MLFGSRAMVKKSVSSFSPTVSGAAASDPAPVPAELPHDLEAERSILAAVMLDNDVCGSAVAQLRPEYFFRSSHQEVFAAMKTLFERGEPIEPPTLAKVLRERGRLEIVGGVPWLSALLDAYALPSNLDAYAATVRDKALLRRTIAVCSRALEACRRPDLSPEEVLETFERDLLAVGDERLMTDFAPLADSARLQLQRIETALQSPHGLTGLETGFTDFDNLTHGLQAGDLIVVAARPSVGKTAFCLNIAQYAAVEGKKTVGVFSMEMSCAALASRLICAQGRIPAQRLRGGTPAAETLTRDEIARLRAAVDALSSAKLFIDDSPNLSVAEMHARSRRLQAEHGLDLLVIDYLQLIRGRERSENRQVEVSQISRDLKAMARDLQTPVVALSQLSRASEGRADRRPLLSDLRDSGGIEQDADLVVFLFRPEMHERTEDNVGLAELIVAKQRNGPTGIVQLVFNAACVRFDSMWK